MSENIGFSPNAAFHDLQAVAPRIDTEEADYYRHIPYPITNDDLASSYVEASAHSAELPLAEDKSRVACLIGTANFITSIRKTPADTVVFIDNSQETCRYIRDVYIPATKTAPNPASWRRRVYEPVLSSINNPAELMRQQDAAWRDQGITPSLEDPELFAEAQQLANEKTLVVWRASIRSTHDMAKLGDALRERSGLVTFMNICNVPTYGDQFQFTDQLIWPLRELPVAPAAPILVTSVFALDKYPRHLQNDAQDRGRLTPATGPFYGLDALRQAGMEDVSRQYPLGRLAVRAYPNNS